MYTYVCDSNKSCQVLQCVHKLHEQQQSRLLDVDVNYDLRMESGGMH